MEGFEQISLKIREELKIQTRVLELLGLSDMGQLRDKYEGERYYQSFRRKVMGLLALEEFLKIAFLNINAVNKEFTPIIKIKSIEIEVITTEFGELPLLDKNPRKPVILIYLISPRRLIICGFVSIEAIRKNLESIQASSSNRGKAVFNGFSEIQQFKSLQELEQLI